jgi:hypothetical protein
MRYLKYIISSQMATNAQVRSAGPGMIAFLSPLLTGPDRSCREWGRRRALILKQDPVKKGSQYGELFARTLRIRKNYGLPSAYPSAKLAWDYAGVLRYYGDGWVAGPLMLYAVGQLPAFVDAIANTDFEKLAASSLTRLLDRLPKAVAGSETERLAWTLSNWDLSAFAPPSASSRPSVRGLPEPILLAKSVANDFSLPYGLQRRQVLRHLQEWLAPIVKAEQNRQ